MKNFILILGVLFSLNLNATIRYVKEGGTGNGSSWAQASGDLQLMINQSVSGDEIRVATGKYYPNRRMDNLGVITPNDKSNAFVLKQGVKIYGGYNAATGQRDIVNNISELTGSMLGAISYHVIVSAGGGINSSTVVDGFVITKGDAIKDGQAKVNGINIISHAGGGIAIYQSSPQISNCIIYNNKAIDGGGIFIYDSSPKILNCFVIYNYASYDSNNALGGGICNQLGAPTIINCTVAGNESVYRAGGIYLKSQASVINCTLVGNHADDKGGGIYFEQSVCKIENSIIWKNTANGSLNTGGTGNGGSVVSNNIIGYGYPGGTNILTIDPLFKDISNIAGSDGILRTADDGLILTGCSPAINYGNNSFVPGDVTTDIAGGNRIQNSTVDLGAYESSLALFSSTISANHTTCGNNNGSATANPVGGQSPFTYLWNTGATTQTITGLAPGTYSVTITSTGGCTSSSATTINGSTGITGTITPSHTTCGQNNGSATANPSGGSGYTYSWSNGGTTQTITGLASGTYSVTITSTAGCTATATTTINGSTGITGTITPSHTTCGLNNGSATANPSGGSGYTYSWSNGANTQTITGLAAGNYTVTITAGGCTATATTTINGSTGISSTITTTHTTCGLNNGSATANPSGGSGYTYVWNNGATTQTVANLAAGDYKVTVTASSGCSVVVATTVNNSTAVVASITSSDESCNNCQNGSATVLATGGDNYTYGWSNGATSQTIDHLAPGVYSVTVTATNGCTAQATATINAFGCPPIEIYPSYSDPSCSGSCNGQISVKPNGGQAPYKFSWSNGQTTAELSGLCAGFYSVTVTDALGCLVQELFPLIEPEYLVVFSTNTDVTTPGGSDGKISLEVWGGTQPYSYLWNTGATTSELSNLQAGIYTVTITDANGCSTTKENIISSPDCAIDIAIVNVTNASTPGAFDGSIVINVSGGTKPYTFQWYLNGVVISTEQDLYGIAPGSYTLVVTDAAGCIVGGGAYTVGYTSATTELDKNTIKLYPNPAFNFVNLYSITKAKVTIFTITGQQVLNFAAEKGENSLDISNLEPGVYFIAVDGHVIRFVKI